MGLLEKIINSQIQSNKNNLQTVPSGLMKKAENILSGSSDSEPDKKKNRFI